MSWEECAASSARLHEYMKKEKMFSGDIRMEIGDE
jgi:hypothetical protein